jgi:hypothetical protein
VLFYTSNLGLLFPSTEGNSSMYAYLVAATFDTISLQNSARRNIQKPRTSCASPLFFFLHICSQHGWKLSTVRKACPARSASRCHRCRTIRQTTHHLCCHLCPNPCDSYTLLLKKLGTSSQSRLCNIQDYPAFHIFFIRLYRKPRSRQWKI